MVQYFLLRGAAGRGTGKCFADAGFRPGFCQYRFLGHQAFHAAVAKGMRLDFRAEFFNLFNHPQFGLPGADFNSPATFGVISSTVNNPRLFQFALKLAF